MMSSYGRILRRPGTALFSATGLVARLPISMVGLGIVLLVSAATGSYGLAGSVSAAYVLANGAFAIVQGRLIDRLGQARVLTVGVTVFGIGLGVLMTSVQLDWPLALSYAAAVVAGAALPTVGSAVRARWAHVLEDADERQTAFALESVVDEAVFMLGPILVTVLATSVHPLAGLGTALAAAVLGTWALAAQRATEPPIDAHHASGGPRPPMPWRTVVPLALVSAALGILFGAAEVTTVAFSEEAGDRAWSGFLLALWALGSLVAGLVTGAVAWQRGADVRVKWGALGMMAAMLPLGFIDSVWLMGVMLLLAGLAIAPTLIAVISLTEQTVPVARRTEGMAFMHTGVVAGVAPGASVAGIVIDRVGASPAYAVAAVAGAIAAVAAQSLPRQRVDADPPEVPTTSLHP